MSEEKNVNVKTRVFPPEVLLEEYRKMLLEEPGISELPLVISGNSMSPFLIGGRDTVYLSRVERPLRRGDAVLYRRRSGAYVLHRIYRISEGGITMVGDAQTVLEHGIRPDQIIAIVTRAERKGKPLAPGNFWWFFFEKIWLRLVPFRRFLGKLFTFFWNRFQKKS